MRIFLLSLIAAATLSGIAPAQGAELYSGEVAVAGQQAKERQAATREALLQVLQKITGLRLFDDYPLLEPAMENAQDMVLSFHYRDGEKALTDGSVISELLLVVSFSPERVDELVRSLHMPLWQADRKPATVWVVVDDGLGRRVMPVELAYVQDAMSDVARQRGMPVDWPLAGPGGEYAVDVQLLWGGYTEDIAPAGSREVLVAAARREGPEWNVRWNLAYGDNNWTWRTRDIELESVLVEGMQTAIDEIALANAITASEQGIWQRELIIGGLDAAADYQRCLSYLQGIGVVDHVAVTGAAPGRVNFRLTLNASPQYLEQDLASGGVLQAGAIENHYDLLP